MIIPPPWCCPWRRVTIVDTPSEKRRQLYWYWLLYSCSSRGRGGRRIQCTAEVQSGSILYHRPWANLDTWRNPLRRYGVPNVCRRSRGLDFDAWLSDSMDKFHKFFLGTWWVNKKIHVCVRRGNDIELVRFFSIAPWHIQEKHRPYYLNEQQICISVVSVVVQIL